MANNKGEKKGKSPAVIVLDIVILALLLFTVLAGIGAISEFADYGYKVTADSFLWRLQDEDYGGMLRLYYNDDTRTKDEEEYYAIAEYAEAAFFYRAFQVTEQSARAQKYLERMGQAAAGMGEFSFVKGKIDGKLGLTN